MGLLTFDQIAAIDDVIVHIFKMLDFEDQLRLANTNRRLQTVYRDCICSHCEFSGTLKIYPNPNGFIIDDNTDSARKFLSNDGLKEFLRLYAGQIEELNIFSPFNIDLGQFKKLTKLKYECQQKSLEYLQMIAETVPNLESLDFQTVFGGINWEIDKFSQMKNLKRLSINSLTHHRMDYRRVYEMLTKLKLDYLRMGSQVEPSDIHENAALEAVHLRELNIRTSFDLWQTSGKFPLFLKSFENLSALTISLSDTVTEETLAQFANACKHLKTLKFDYANFAHIQNFPLGTKVRDLTFGECHGLTSDNLKQLLTASNITKFKSIDTRYGGPVNDFMLSPLIQELDINLIDLRRLKPNPAGHTHLRELSWCSDVGNPKTKIIPNVDILRFCPNLERLQARWCQIELDTVLQFGSLHSLAIHCYELPGQESSSYITAILKHQPLTDLYIDFNQFYSLDSSAILPEGFSTNVTNLKIHYEIFKLALDFWLDLFRHNTKMRLECCDFFPHEIDFLMELARCKNFPKSLRQITVFGFTINCKDLRNRPDAVVKELLDVTNYLDDQYCIIFKRIP